MTYRHGITYLVDLIYIYFIRTWESEERGKKIEADGSTSLPIVWRFHPNSIMYFHLYAQNNCPFINIAQL